MQLQAVEGLDDIAAAASGRVRAPVTQYSLTNRKLSGLGLIINATAWSVARQTSRAAAPAPATAAPDCTRFVAGLSIPILPKSRVCTEFKFHNVRRRLPPHQPAGLVPQ